MRNYYMVHMEGSLRPEEEEDLVLVYHDREKAETEAAWCGMDVTQVRIVPLHPTLWQRVKAWWRK